MGIFNRISRTWSLMIMSWRLLIEDKRILIFPFCSLIACVTVLASCIIPLVVTGRVEPPAHGASTHEQVAYYAVWFMIYYCCYFVIVFFNAALVNFVVLRMEGKQPTLGDGFNGALARLPLIAGWALIAATVGLILRIIEDRHQRLGQVIAAILGSAWALVTFLVVPILVVERRNPFSALKQSTAMLKQTWGEQIACNFSFSTISFLLAIPGIGLIVLCVAYTHGAVLLAGIGAAVFYFVFIALVQSALESIFQTAIYFYARNRQIPDGWDATTLDGAISAR